MCTDLCFGCPICNFFLFKLMDERNVFNYFQSMPFRIALLSLHTVLLSRDSLASLRWKVISVTKSQSNRVLINWSAHKLLPSQAPHNTHAAAQGCIACCLWDGGAPDFLLWKWHPQLHLDPMSASLKLAWTEKHKNNGKYCVSTIPAQERGKWGSLFGKCSTSPQQLLKNKPSVRVQNSSNNI